MIVLWMPMGWTQPEHMASMAQRAEDLLRDRR